MHCGNSHLKSRGRFLHTDVQSPAESSSSSNKDRRHEGGKAFECLSVGMRVMTQWRDEKRVCMCVSLTPAAFFTGSRRTHMRQQRASHQSRAAEEASTHTHVRFYHAVAMVTQQLVGLGHQQTLDHLHPMSPLVWHGVSTTCRHSITHTHTHTHTHTL